MTKSFHFLNGLDDRRQNMRFKSAAFQKVLVNLNPMPPFFGNPIKADLIDLSAGGMSLYIGEFISLETRFLLELQVAPHTIMRAKIKVCRVRQEKERFKIGLKFLELAAEMKATIDEMSLDFHRCQARLRSRSRNICRSQCAFYSWCDHPEKVTPPDGEPCSPPLRLLPMEGPVWA